jgi:hypothetical protein
VGAARRPGEGASQFVAAVEVAKRPELRGLPAVVGGDGDPTRQVVAAALLGRALVSPRVGRPGAAVAGGGQLVAGAPGAGSACHPFTGGRFCPVPRTATPKASDGAAATATSSTDLVAVLPLTEWSRVMDYSCRCGPNAVVLTNGIWARIERSSVSGRGACDDWWCATAVG